MRLLPDIIKHRYLTTVGSSVLIEEEKPAPKPVEEEESAESVPMIPQEVLEEIERLKSTILEQAQNEALVERESILKDANSEAEDIKAQAMQQGYAEGIRRKSQEINDSLVRLNSLMGSLESSFAQYMEQYRDELSEMAIEVTKKLILKRISEDDTELSELVTQAVSSVKKAEWIRVEISNELPSLRKRLLAELADAKIEIQEKALSPDSCIIHTPDGVIDASVHTQLDNLKQSLTE